MEVVKSMPLPRTIAAQFSSLAGRCALGGLASVALSFAVAAQGGTVAVTGDGTSSLPKPTVGDAAGGSAADTQGKGKNQKKKSPPAAAAAAAGRDSSPPSSDQRAIVALVNDEPITGYEMEQRAMMLSGTNIQTQAKANFEAIIKNPKTSERLKAILQETVKANEGKPREEIIAIFERRKKEYGMSLQKQAFDSARNSALPAMKKQALSLIHI